MTGRVLVWATGLELAMSLAVVLVEGYSMKGLQTAARYAGIFSLAVFSVVFLFHQRPGQVAIRVFGLPYHFFAVVHLYYLVLLLVYFAFNGITVDLFRLGGGLVGGVFAVAMPLIYERHQSGLLSDKAFNQIALVFQYFLWLIFFLTYYARVDGTLPGLGGSYAEYIALLGWVSLLLGMKVTALLRLKPFSSR